MVMLHLPLVDVGEAARADGGHLDLERPQHTVLGHWQHQWQHASELGWS
jgi:hypothetical protein